MFDDVLRLFFDGSVDYCISKRNEKKRWMGRGSDNRKKGSREGGGECHWVLRIMLNMLSVNENYNKKQNNKIF